MCVCLCVCVYVCVCVCERERERENVARHDLRLHTRVGHAQPCAVHLSHTLHTTHYTLHTTHYTLHTTYYTLHTSHYTLPSVGGELGPFPSRAELDPFVSKALRRGLSKVHFPCILGQKLTMAPNTLPETISGWTLVCATCSPVRCV